MARATDTAVASALAIGGFVLSVIAVLLRFFSRRVTQKKISWDDYLILACLAALSARNGRLWTGRQYLAETDSRTRVLTLLDLQYTHSILCSSILLLNQMAVVVLILRNCRQQPTLAKVCRCILVVESAAVIAFTIPSIVQCNPLSKAWKPLNEGSCLDRAALMQTFNVFNAVGLGFVFMLAGWTIRRHETDKTHKACLYGIMILGVFTITADIARVVLWTKQIMPIYANSSTYPESLKTAATNVCFVLETTLGILCACLPTVQPFMFLFCSRNSQRTPFSAMRERLGSTDIESKPSFERSRARGDIDGVGGMRAEMDAENSIAELGVSAELQSPVEVAGEFTHRFELSSGNPATEVKGDGIVRHELSAEEWPVKVSKKQFMGKLEKEARIDHA